jgi:hypothetical protein
MRQMKSAIMNGLQSGAITMEVYRYFVPVTILAHALKRLDGLTIFGRSLSVSQVRWNVTSYRNKRGIFKYCCTFTT